MVELHYIYSVPLAGNNLRLEVIRESRASMIMEGKKSIS
jgi:hypothetical protein